MLWHLTAHTRGALAPLTRPETAPWLWGHLRRRFPDALAAALMPNHPHLIVPGDDPERLRQGLRAVLGAFAREHGMGQLWLPVPEPEPLPTPDKVLRGVRYVLLNPCRPFRWADRMIRLVDDPLLWPWTTLRDTVGAVASPWVNLERLVPIGLRPVKSVGALLGYVSRDDWVAEGAERLPGPAPDREHPTVPLNDVVEAVRAAHRVSSDQLGRRGPARTALLAMAWRQGGRDCRQLCALTGTSRMTHWRTCRQPVETSAEALCLADPRLRAEGAFDPLIGPKMPGIPLASWPRRVVGA